MKKLSFCVAAASVAALSFATASRADDTTSTGTTTTTTTTPQQSPPAQTTQGQPVQSVTVQTPPAQSAPPPSSTTTTTAAPYEPSGDTYAESSTEHRPNRTLLSTGVGMFVVSYGASVVAGAVSPLDSDKRLFVPVVGPWMDLNDRSGNGNNEDLNKAMIITSGIVQGAGVLLGLSSLVIPESTTTTTKRTSHEAKVDKPEVHVTPVSFGAGAGVGAVGTF